MVIHNTEIQNNVYTWLLATTAMLYTCIQCDIKISFFIYKLCDQCPLRLGIRVVFVEPRSSHFLVHTITAQDTTIDGGA